MAQNISSPGWSWDSAWSFLKSELTPYPGRGALVARMTIAATIMMLCIMTFRLPGAALGAYYTLVISRDTTHATVEGAVTILGALTLGLAEVLLGAILFAGSPLLHFLWVATSLFIIFFLISAATKYNFATSFGFLVAATIPVWDFPGNPETAVTNTLYAALAVAVGAIITVVVEVVFAHIHQADLIQEGVDDRLRIVAQFLIDVRNPDSRVKAKLVQYADIGTGSLRRLLTRTEGGQEDYARKASLIALTGRLVDLCAGFIASRTPITDAQQERLIHVSGRVDQIRVFRTLSYSQQHEHSLLQPAGAGFLQLLESTVQLAHDALRQPELMNEYTAQEDIPHTPLLKPDAFVNTAHLKFALRGTAAALSCYLAYHLLAWGGLNSSVATCMITALSTTGSSRQKQILRVAGAITGGLLIAIGAEVFVLPHLDSIAEFTVLFAAVTIFSGWFATSSPRLSYYGLQVAFAFYIVELRVFAPETQLTPARDNVAGIVLGLVVMWVVFDQLAPGRDSMAEMKHSLVASIQQTIAFIRERPLTSKAAYLKRIRALRESINDNFSKVRTSADAVLFEFGPNRAQALKLRDNARAWQPQIRTLFLLQVTLAHTRLHEPTGRLPSEVERLQEMSARLLEMLTNVLNRGSMDLAHQGYREIGPNSGEKELANNSVAGSLALDSLVIIQGLVDQVLTSLES